ncbi:MAG TPA: amidohydrolase [Candidatus Nanopelagicales bacterium]|nr:amidohydrolase [Candidatus Nanopelagicales bacterium]
MNVDSSVSTAVLDRVAEAAPGIISLSHEIHADPELAYDEHRSMARCADLLEAAGYPVERGAYGVPTAFAARAGSAGPHLVVCAEYDALPVVGHACGHNIIAAAAVGTGLVLLPLLDQIGLRLTVLGTPAEEVGGGKVDLINGGALTGVDAALMMHPAPYDDIDGAGLAIEEWSVVVHGKASHASSEPALGRNALDGLVAGYTAVAMLRQHLRPWQQVHGIITHGGDAANIVPERAAATYYLRALDMPDLADLRERVRAAFEGAAAATGTSVVIEQVGHVYEPITTNVGLAKAFTAACDLIGRPYTPDPKGPSPGGSTDFGNVSQLVPGLHANLAVHSWPAVNHQHEFAAHCVGPQGDATLLDAVKAMSLTALELAANPGLVRAAG